MTLTDLITTLETHCALPASRVKDCKTSLRYLASALGHPSPEECPLTAGVDEATWAPALEAHWRTLAAKGRTISATTRKNTRHNVRTVFRAAEAHELLPKPIRLLPTPPRGTGRRHWRDSAQYPTAYRSTIGGRRFTLPPDQWPADIQEGWRTYQAKCGLRLRETTFRTYAVGLATFFGCVANIVGRTPTWEDLFDVAQLTAFVRWHGARLQRPITAQGRNVVMMIAAIAVVLKHPHARAVADFRNELKAPEPVHTKRLHWVSLATLEAVAEACLAEGRAPFYAEKHLRNPGVRRSTKFQLGVMLKLLRRVPLRQRNLREMQLDKHLYQDPATGHWHLHFSGSDLKIGTRQGRVNEYKLNLSEYAADFIPTLEEWIQVHRPRIPNPTDSKLLFLTYHGRPFTQATLYEELSHIVDQHTGQRFYPHLIRTIWATEFLNAPPAPDFVTAAIILGDTVGVVMSTYHDIVNRDHQAKASAFNAAVLSG